MNGHERPPLIAVVGCDGSGKSTLTEALLAWMNEARPTVICHLGKQSGNIGRRIGRLPLMGERLDRSIQSKAQKAQAEGGPALPEALVIYAFSLRRVRRFRHMLRLRAEGWAIIADRFPQLLRPGPMDGLGLAGARPSGLVGLLARAERSRYEDMVATVPDLVLRLNVSLDTAMRRKPDHRPRSLARKVADVPHLSFAGAPIVELDAEQPFDVVLAQAQSAIGARLATLDVGGPDDQVAPPLPTNGHAS
ncbi:Thymidylate kinase [Sphingomonas gellani]|uniref:Thymidylate kinase n=1 Tax=Sphingomonas gellani TaxID=1166340 RepID=A0A1H8DAX7_9SPHN|nr:nucleoside triphosphate hydrolase [Sphingomonas gellani]SEN03647.1 Thymidylate kinase [Sphingomonas gellani]